MKTSIKHIYNSTGKVLLAIFIGELLIMVGFQKLLQPFQYASEFFWEIADPLLLSLIVTPVLYLSVLRPMKRQHQLLVRQMDELTISAATFNSQEGVIVTDVNHRIIKINTAFTRITGYTSDEILGETPAVLQSGKQDKEFYSELLHSLAHSNYWQGEIWNRRKNGEIYPELLSISAVTSNTGNKYFVGIFSDISKLKKSESALRVAATAFESAEGMIITDFRNCIIRSNSAFTEITGYPADEVLGKNPKLLSAGVHDDEFYNEMWVSINTTGKWEGEIWNQRKNGEVYPEHLTITAVKDSAGCVTNYIGAFTDITKFKKAEEEIKKLAFYDPLTHLPNRQLLLDRLQQAISTSAHTHQYGALMFIDPNNLTTLNDTMGHDKGDLLLLNIAQRISACLHKCDMSSNLNATAARLIGDKFAILITNLNNDQLQAAEQTEEIGLKIIASLNQPYWLGTVEYHGSFSIGATLFDAEQKLKSELFKQADIAMSQAKNAGQNNFRFFDPRMQDIINERSTLEGELRKAVNREELRLYYQIQVDNDGRKLGAEALIRWIHPERGIISPAQFIPLAEETGLIVPIGHWVIETACAQLSEYASNNLTGNLVLSINVSAQQFQQEDFVLQIKESVERHAINPNQLKIELTEGVLVKDIDHTILVMNQLKEIGVQLSLDDFGTGYSSLQYLKRLPLDQLKIDQSFVRDIASDNNDQAIVITIIAMAHSLGLEVIAEGVETENQRKFLADNGCFHYQGYMFGQPVPIDKFNEMLNCPPPLNPAPSRAPH